MSFECAKSMNRRLHTPGFATRYMVGHAIDIGGGNDGLDKWQGLWPGLKSVRNWDKDDGDAELMDGLKPATFDLVHSSHCLEHMRNPVRALENWWRILKHGGHLVLMVPDEDLYEQGVFPSTWNPDHKHTFTTKFEGRSFSFACWNVQKMILELEGSQLLRLAVLEDTFLPGLPRQDQTGNPVTESAIEVVARKL